MKPAPLDHWNDITDFILNSAYRLQPLMTPEENQVYMFIFYRTFPYFKKSESIPLRHFMNGVIDRQGAVIARRLFMSKTTLHASIKHLEGKAIIWSHVDTPGGVKQYGITDPDLLDLDLISQYVTDHQSDEIERGKIVVGAVDRKFARPQPVLKSRSTLSP